MAKEILTIHKKTLIYSAIIGTLFSVYDKDEKTKTHKQLESRLRKGTKKFIKMYGLKKVAKLTSANNSASQTIWQKLIDKYPNIDIEASTTILAIINKDEEQLAKHFGLSSNILAKWAKPLNEINNKSLSKEEIKKIDTNSFFIAEKLEEHTNSFLGLEKKEKKSVIAIRDRIEQNKRERTQQ
jgi:hypothetical protein